MILSEECGAAVGRNGLIIQIFLDSGLASLGLPSWHWGRRWTLPVKAAALLTEQGQLMAATFMVEGMTCDAYEKARLRRSICQRGDGFEFGVGGS
jgi:hypothetical protein